MSLLFSDLNISNNGDNLVTYGNQKDVCIFTLREATKGKHASEAHSIRRKMEGKLQGVPVVKFRHSGAEIVISLDYIHKLATLYPLAEENTATAEEAGVADESQKAK